MNNNDKVQMIFTSPFAPDWMGAAARHLLRRSPEQAMNEIEFFRQAIQQRFDNLRVAAQVDMDLG